MFVFVGFADIVSYNACGTCKSKAKDEKCGKCSADLSKEENCVFSFFFTLMVMEDNEVSR